jgi:AcrR family transcriptional regulator
MKSPAKKTAAEPTATRERIRAVAEELYVLRGHDGFSFGDIARAVGTTRANIHHHFRNKRQLMAELTDRFASDAEARIADNWTKPNTTFAQRLAAQCEDLKRFYDRFNGKQGDRHVWSPLARLRLDLAVLGESATQALQKVDRAYDRYLRQAVTDAIKSGELEPDTPIQDVTRMLRVILMSCAPMTQDTGSFREVARLFATMERMIEAAWASHEGRNRARR